ncbi:hypothetical protein [Methylotenera sp.]|uniref:hypothetical protein n=1 Tax=Methylotenera sp. TaxID=2051956 RepID=UPI00272F74EB|nr:hypothetical protein [Methylotenera sp.]MDP2229944.1 hypothetical protein [Methylotenera sp.]
MATVMNQDKQNVHPIKIRNCTFGFRCEEKWEDMKETYLDIAETIKTKGRFCGVCKEQVYLISTSDELMDAIKLNQCVAIEVANPIKTEHLLGCPLSYDEEDIF